MVRSKNIIHWLLLTIVLISLFVSTASALIEEEAKDFFLNTYNLQITKITLKLNQ
jgi:hypothetical protein